MFKPNQSVMSGIRGLIAALVADLFLNLSVCSM
jgi:hypothetical protein